MLLGGLLRALLLPAEAEAGQLEIRLVRGSVRVTGHVADSATSGPAQRRDRSPERRLPDPLAWVRQSGDVLGHHRVGLTGFEPAASSSRTTRATKLRHSPRAW